MKTLKENPAMLHAATRIIPKVGARAIRNLGCNNAEVDLESLGLSKYSILADHVFQGHLQQLRQSNASQLYPDRTEDQQQTTNATIDFLREKKQGTRHGFYVLGALQAYSVDAFRNHYDSREERTVEKLQATLTHNKTIDGVIGFLANMDGRKNGNAEEHLGLVGTQYAQEIEAGFNSFTVSNGTEREAGHISIRVQSYVDLINLYGPTTVLREEGDGACPAQRFLPMAWLAMTEIAATDERFYATDLGLIGNKG